VSRLIGQVLGKPRSSRLTRQPRSARPGPPRNPAGEARPRAHLYGFGTISTDRLRFQARLMKPFSLQVGEMFVDRRERREAENRRPISSRLGGVGRA